MHGRDAHVTAAKSRHQEFRNLRRNLNSEFKTADLADSASEPLPTFARLILQLLNSRLLRFHFLVLFYLHGVRFDFIARPVLQASQGFRARSVDSDDLRVPEQAVKL